MARAFQEHVHPHPELVRVCKEFFGTDDLKSPKLKLAHVCKLDWGREGKGIVSGGASSREDWARPWVLKWGKGKEGFMG